MKKYTKRQPCPRLRTLGTAQLAQIAGGVSAVEYWGVIAAVTVAVLDTLPARW